MPTMAFCSPGDIIRAPPHDRDRYGSMTMQAPAAYQLSRAVSARSRAESRADSCDFEEAEEQLHEWSKRLLDGTLSHGRAAASLEAAWQTDVQVWEGASNKDALRSCTSLMTLTGVASAVMGVAWSASSASSGRDGCCTKLSGRLILRGGLEPLEQGLQPSARAVLGEALAEVVAPAAAGCLHDAGSEAGYRVAVSAPRFTGGGDLQFAFQVSLADPNDLLAARESFQVEANLGGAKRLLPRLAEGCFGDVGRLSIRLELD